MFGPRLASSAALASVHCATFVLLHRAWVRTVRTLGARVRPVLTYALSRFYIDTWVSCELNAKISHLIVNEFAATAQGVDTLVRPPRLGGAATVHIGVKDTSEGGCRWMRSIES